MSAKYICNVQTIENQIINTMMKETLNSVKAIVKKYEELASNTEAVIKTKKDWDDHKGEYYVPNDYMRLYFVEQLMSRIYKLKCGDTVNSEYARNYLDAAAPYYIDGLLDEKDEQFLVDNFHCFVDYAKDNRETKEISLDLFIGCNPDMIPLDR